MHMYVTSALQKTDMKAVMLQLAMDLHHKKVERECTRERKRERGIPWELICSSFTFKERERDKDMDIKGGKDN